MSASYLSNQDVLKNNQLTIAVLAGSMSSVYQEGIMRGVAYVAAQKNYNLIVFCGGAINSTDPFTLSREQIFDLVDMDLIAGIISPFSSLTRFIDKQQSHDFIEQFSSVPIINIGDSIHGHTNVVTDYESGLCELFEHFYHVHGCRNIVLMRGPNNHTSSEKRTAIYKQQLAQYQLPFDQDNVIYADLNRYSAKLNMGLFLDNIKKPVDAIITINDGQAMGVIDACQERGIRVPEDIAIAGSMNTIEGSFTEPTLTSIQEPLFELGHAAASELIAQIEGKTPRPELKIPTSLVIRHSCGCGALPAKQVEPNNPLVISKPTSVGVDRIFSETQASVKQIVEQYKGGIIHAEVAALLSKYQQAIDKKDYACFLIALKNKLEGALKSEDISVWLAVMTKLELGVLDYLENATDSQYLRDFSNRLMVLRNEIEQIAVKYQWFEGESYLNCFSDIVTNLNSTFAFSTIKKYIVDVLQLSELYISLFAGGDSDAVLAENMVAVRRNKSIELKNRSFIAKKLLPEGIESYQERFTLLVFPLSFRNQHLGSMIVNLSAWKGMAFENLRAIISTALKNELLIKDLKSAERRFSDIAHSTSNWLWETDRANRFTYCSESTIDIIGYSAEVLLTKKINALSIKEGDGYLRSMLNHENITECECWCRHKNGKVVCLLISAIPNIIKGVFNGYRGLFEDITEQRSQEDKIKNLAYSDVLTGLPNRTLFQETLAETLAFSAINHKKFALMFIDLDHFKNINDSMGHAAGDQLLIKLAERLKQAIRSQDMLARLGGDEFVIILPEITDAKGLVQVADRIFSKIKKPIIVQGKSVYSTLSLGISIYPTDGVDEQSLLQKGDNAMYQAKSQGRNNYVFYDHLLEKKFTLRNMHEKILREALVTGGFILNYQPQVAVHSGRVVGFEALVRIKNARHGIVPPNHFIPLAEELGLIWRIDEWVFDTACAQYATWRELGLKKTRLSINLSAKQLGHDALLDTYINILKRYAIPPGDIQIEITENALIENEHAALTILQGFKNYGVSIALDDFGTGYSSLSCINLYPIDTIKIDRSFVIDAIDNLRNKAIIQGIILIAKNLHLKIIAEGVETQEQYELMLQLGCHEIQGYYFYKPCCVADAQALLEN